MASCIEHLNKLWHSQLIISEEVFNELYAKVKAMFMPQKPEKVMGINQSVLPYILMKKKWKCQKFRNNEDE